MPAPSLNTPVQGGAVSKEAYAGGGQSSATANGIAKTVPLPDLNTSGWSTVLEQELVSDSIALTDIDANAIGVKLSMTWLNWSGSDDRTLALTWGTQGDTVLGDGGITGSSIQEDGNSNNWYDLLATKYVPIISSADSSLGYAHVVVTLTKTFEGWIGTIIGIYTRSGGVGNVTGAFSIFDSGNTLDPATLVLRTAGSGSASIDITPTYNTLQVQQLL